MTVFVIKMNVLLKAKSCFLYILLNTILLCRLHVQNVNIPFTFPTTILYKLLSFGRITPALTDITTAT